MPVLRTYIKPFNCIPSVVCGDIIDATWGNEMRNLGQSAFERGESVLSLRCSTEGAVRIPIVGFCWNMVQSYGTNAESEVEYTNAPAIKFQPAFPRLHHIECLYRGTEWGNSAYGVPINDNGIHGFKHELGGFENAGYNTAQIIFSARRGVRYVVPNPHITKINSNVQVWEMGDNPANSLGYRQHFECWYCRENPSGAGFPPIKVLIFDDNDCPLNTDIVRVSKEITIPTPTVGQTESDYILFTTWCDVPYYFGGQHGFGAPDAYFVHGVKYEDYRTNEAHGLLDINVKLFKKCN